MGEDLRDYELRDKLDGLRKRVEELQGYPEYTPSPTKLAAAMLEVVEMMQEIAKRLPPDPPSEPGYR